MAKPAKSRAMCKVPAKVTAQKKTANAADAPPLSKLDTIAKALHSSKGASISDLMELTGWQAHSVRGALAGGLKKRGFAITSTKADGGERIYRIAKS